MRPINIMLSTYIAFDVENNDKYSKFKVDDHVRIQNTNIFLQKTTDQIGLKRTENRTVVKRY